MDLNREAVIPGLVSVIMPAYNAARFIRKSIDSILCQSYRNFEIIVVDDGSTDQTLEILGSYHGQLRVYSQVNGGPSHARNNALAHASGEFVWFLDADDLLAPEALRATVAHLSADRDADVAIGKWAYVDESGRVTSDFFLGCKQGPTDPPILFRRMLLQTLVPTGTSLFRRSALSVCGGWDENLWCAEDRDLWLRLLEMGCRFDFLDVPVALYRQHESNSTLNLARVELHMGLFLEKWFGDRACENLSRAHLKPYAWALALLYMAEKCNRSSNQYQVSRLITSTCDFLKQALPDEGLIKQLLWEVYEKPWEREIHSVLWRVGRNEVACLCWVHARRELKKRCFAESTSWFFQLILHHPTYFFYKFQRLVPRYFNI